jgi:hypothetical protein
MAAEDVGAGARLADIAGKKQGNAARPNIGGADGVLRLTHAPDQCRRLLRGEHLGDALELLAGDAGDALDLLGRPLFDLLADILETVDALRDKFLVLPAVLQDVPHHPIEHRNVGAWPEPHVFGRVRRLARQAGINDDDIRLVELGAL